MREFYPACLFCESTPRLLRLYSVRCSRLPRPISSPPIRTAPSSGAAYGARCWLPPACIRFGRLCGAPNHASFSAAWAEEQLDARILREFEENRNKQFRNVINSLFPAKLLPVMLSLGGIDPYKQVNAVSKAERQHFEELITHFPFTVTGTRGFREAIITQGGVSVKEIRPGTMEAKKKEGLYFVGEVLDLDALTGGFNLQIAWASAHAAAEEIRAKEEQE